MHECILLSVLAIAASNALLLCCLHEFFSFRGQIENDEYPLKYWRTYAAKLAFVIVFEVTLINLVQCDNVACHFFVYSMLSFSLVLYLTN